MTGNGHDPDFPMRLNKYLAREGVATRRDADGLISAGRVLVNGKRAVIGMKVAQGDSVELTGKARKRKQRVYIAFNKPRGVITHSPGKGETDIARALPRELHGLGLFPIGRLDKDSHGLIILTDDGRVTDRLLRPDAEHEKEYAVRTKLPIRSSFRKHMEAGVDIEGYVTKPAKVKVTGEHTFSIVLTEGKKHQVRRMVVAMHNEVTDLKRTRVMNIRLGSLKAGDARPIEGKELDIFLGSLGLAES
jgi:23S rRNA pseudouridine2604 synthase